SGCSHPSVLRVFLVQDRSPGAVSNFTISRDQKSLVNELHDLCCLLGQLLRSFLGEAEDNFVVHWQAHERGETSLVQLDKSPSRDVPAGRLNPVVHGGVRPILVHEDAPASDRVDEAVAHGFVGALLRELLGSRVGLPEALYRLVGVLQRDTPLFMDSLLASTETDGVIGTLPCLSHRVLGFLVSRVPAHRAEGTSRGDVVEVFALSVRLEHAPITAVRGEEHQLHRGEVHRGTDVPLFSEEGVTDVAGACGKGLGCNRPGHSHPGTACLATVDWDVHPPFPVHVLQDVLEPGRALLLSRLGLENGLSQRMIDTAENRLIRRELTLRVGSTRLRPLGELESKALKSRDDLVRGPNDVDTPLSSNSTPLGLFPLQLLNPHLDVRDIHQLAGTLHLVGNPVKSVLPANEAISERLPRDERHQDVLEPVGEDRVHAGIEVVALMEEGHLPPYRVLGDLAVDTLLELPDEGVSFSLQLLLDRKSVKQRKRINVNI